MDRGTLLGAAQIGLAVGPALKRYRMKKHFQIEITDTTFTYTRDTAGIDAEAALDGFYILRTSLTETDLPAADVVRAYKNLEHAERAFGSLKGGRARPGTARAVAVELIQFRPGADPSPISRASCRETRGAPPRWSKLAGVLDRSHR